jgi:hypothetical protein
MGNFFFRTSLFCTVLLCIFMWTRLSLNGYKTDFYFFVATLLLNIACFWTQYKVDQTRRKSFINLSLATMQAFGLFIFLWLDTLQADKIYKPHNIKYNLYSSLTGFYKRAYFKRHKAELCNDGQLWETKVPFYFPLIEIETARDQCHKVGDDSSYAWLYRHVPE